MVLGYRLAAGTITVRRKLLLLLAVVISVVTIDVSAYLKRFHEHVVEPYKWQTLVNTPVVPNVEGEDSAEGIKPKHHIDMPTTLLSEEHIPLFRGKIRNFGCDVCQSAVWVGSTLVAEKFDSTKRRTKSDFGKLTVIIEDMMDGLKICLDEDKWQYVANHSEVFTFQDLKSFCGLLLEGDEDVFVEEMERRRSIDEATLSLCVTHYKVCNVGDLWHEGDKLEQRRETNIRNRAYGDYFREKFREAPNAKVTESGLHYAMYKQGMPFSDEQLEWKSRIQYNSTLVNGVSFDDSSRWGEYVDVGLKETVPGMAEGVKLAGIGGDIVIAVPPELGYSDKGAGRFVGPDSTVLFRLKVLEAVEPFCADNSTKKEKEHKHAEGEEHKHAEGEEHKHAEGEEHKHAEGEEHKHAEGGEEKESVAVDKTEQQKKTITKEAAAKKQEAKKEESANSKNASNTEEL